MTTADLHSLTGAHVLHATTDTERVAFQRHLAGCGPCAEEVRELRETAARLGLAAAATPPECLRHAVLARIHRAPPRVPVRLAAAAAAVLLAAAVSLGGILVTRQDDLHDIRHQVTAVAAVVLADDAQVAHAGGATLVVSRAQDRAVLLTDLPPLPAARVYQAWAAEGTRFTSAGTLTGNPAATELTNIGAADRIVITVEPEGGSRRPTTSTGTTVTVP